MVPFLFVLYFLLTLQEDGVRSLGDRGPVGVGSVGSDHQHSARHGGLEPGMIRFDDIQGRE